MARPDPVLIEKWKTRHTEWMRLADLSTEPYVAHVCHSMAAQAEMMARFWGS